MFQCYLQNYFYRDLISPLQNLQRGTLREVLSERALWEKALSERGSLKESAFQRKTLSKLHFEMQKASLPVRLTV